MYSAPARAMHICKIQILFLDWPLTKIFAPGANAESIAYLLWFAGCITECARIHTRRQAYQAEVCLSAGVQMKSQSTAAG